MRNEIWRWFEGEYKAHCKERADYDKILSWKRSKPGGVYYIPGEPNEYDVILPEDYLDRARKLLGLDSQNKPLKRKSEKSQPSKVGANRALSAKDLRDPESPSRASNSR